MTELLSIYNCPYRIDDGTEDGLCRADGGSCQRLSSGVGPCPIEEDLGMGMTDYDDGDDEYSHDPMPAVEASSKYRGPKVPEGEIMILPDSPYADARIKFWIDHPDVALGGFLRVLHDALEKERPKPPTRWQRFRRWLGL